MSEQTQPPLILCALHTTRLLRVWIIKVHLKLWNASTPPSPRHLLHNSAVWKHFGSPLPRPFSPHSGISLDFSSPLFPQGMDAEGGEGASCSINSCSICRACGWGSGRRLEFGTVCGVYAWGLSPDSAWMGAQGRGPPTSLHFCAISIFGTVIAHWRVWIFMCVCVWERWEASIVSFHRLPGDRVTLSPAQTVPSLDIWAVLYTRARHPVSEHIYLSSQPFSDSPYWERKSGTGLSKGTSEIVAQLTSFFLRDTGEALDLSVQLKSP